MADGFGRNFLLLQGPHGPFFRQLGQLLEQTGAAVGWAPASGLRTTVLRWIGAHQGYATNTSARPLSHGRANICPGHDALPQVV